MCNVLLESFVLFLLKTLLVNDFAFLRLLSDAFNGLKLFEDLTYSFPTLLFNLVLFLVEYVQSPQSQSVQPELQPQLSEEYGQQSFKSLPIRNNLMQTECEIIRQINLSDRLNSRLLLGSEANSRKIFVEELI